MTEVEKLAKAIKESGMHLTTIVAKSGLSRPLVYKILNNQIATTRFDTIKRICDAINVDIENIIELDKIEKIDHKNDFEDLRDEQKANLYLIKQLNTPNNLIANGYLLRLLQEQEQKNK